MSESLAQQGIAGRLNLRQMLAPLLIVLILSMMVLPLPSFALDVFFTFADIAEEVVGVYPKIMLEGQMDVGAWSCGLVAGLIHDIPSCQELIDRIMNEANGIIRERLGTTL